MIGAIWICGTDIVINGNIQVVIIEAPINSMPLGSLK
jgi:hypothetical protein